MDNTITISIISAISAFLIALIPYFLKKKDSNATTLTKKTDIDVELFRFNDLKDATDNVLNGTKADGFTMMMAHNGKDEVKFATAIYEQHKSVEKSNLSFGATNKYIKVEFDNEYRNMLKVAERDGCLNMDVSKMPDSLQKNIFISEKVTYAGCYFIKRYHEYKSENKDLILYCTLVTHQEQPYDTTDEVKFKTFIDYLKNELFA